MSVILSATMIIKDEAARLGPCLASIASIVDEIVIVDTGSQDASVDIARSFGAKVHQEPWAADFSLHRNRSLDLARGEWAFVIDGDEELLRPQELRATVLAAHELPDVDGVSVWVDAIDGEQVVDQMVAVRAFRRSRGRYVRPVHNQLQGVRKVLPSRAAIRSYYGGTLERKAARSIPMLESMLAERPDDVHAHFFLARTYFALRRFADCWRHCEPLLREPPAVPSFAPLWVWATWSALALDGIDAAEDVLARGLERHPHFADLRHCQIALATLRWNEAVGKVHDYVLTSFTSLEHHRNLPAAVELLGLPLEFSDRNAPAFASGGGAPMFMERSQA